VAGLLDNLLASLVASNMQQPGNSYSPTGAEGIPDPSAVDPFANAPAPAAPKPAAQPFGPVAGLLNAPAGSPYSQPAGPFDQPPATNDVQAQEPQVFKDGVPLPKPRPDTGLNGRDEAATGAPLSLSPPMPSDSAQLPPGATPTGPAAPAAAPAASSGGGIGGLLGNVAGKLLDPNHAATWMALASGFAGAPTLGMGIGRAAAAAGPAMQADRAMQMKMQGIQATYQSVRQELQAQGVPAGEAASKALAMAQNPDLLKAMAPQVYGTNPPEWKEVARDAISNPIMGLVDVRKGTINGTPMAKWQAGDTAGGGVAGGPGGATSVDPSLTGQAFLDAVSKNPKFGPGEASKVQGIAEGKIAYPTGFIMKTPYGRWLTNAVGQYEPGIDSTKINQRKTFNTQLGSTTPTSIGGQKNLMGTSLGHLGEVADAAVSLQNSSGPLPNWIPGSAQVAQGINAVSNTSVDRQAKANALNDAVQKLSGELGKLYSGSSGGGIAEREQTQSRFGPSLTPQAMAASLEMSKALINSKLAALENQQDQIFGPNNPGRTDFLGTNGRAAIAKIDSAIARLRGQQPGAAADTGPPAGVPAPAGPAAAAPMAPAPMAPPRAAAPPPGNYVYNPATRSLVPAQ